MWSRTILMLACIAFLASCRAKKAVVTTKADSVITAVPSESVVDLKAQKLASVRNNQMAFNTFSGKAKAALSIGGNSNDVTMNIRIKNQEAIWVSVTAIAGLEVARALITPDSVRVINRLENEYTKKPFSYLYEFTNNKITFATLQSVLTGNAITGFLTESTEVTLDGTQAKLKNSIVTLLYELMLNADEKVTQSTLSDSGAGQSLNMLYGDFQPVLTQQVPHSIVMKSKAKSKNISLDLKFSKIELDVPLEIPFKAPDRYTIKN